VIIGWCSPGAGDRRVLTARVIAQGVEITGLSNIWHQSRYGSGSNHGVDVGAGVQGLELTNPITRWAARVTIATISQAEATRALRRRDADR